MRLLVYWNDALGCIWTKAFYTVPGRGSHTGRPGWASGLFVERDRLAEEIHAEG